MEPILVFTTVPDAGAAARIARALVEQRLAACVTQLAPAVSTYRWRGAIETAHELPLLIKTEAARYPELETALRRMHPNELPEIIAVPIEHGLPDYLIWIAGETLADDLG
jgi:periplasmic divalent cation tolerance protein